MRTGDFLIRQARSDECFIEVIEEIAQKINALCVKR